MTRFEEATRVKPGFKYAHPDFPEELDARVDCFDSIRPLARYTEEIAIFDMVSGEFLELWAALSSLQLLE
ncbi:MAG: hypothetical protein AAGG55_06360 [Pseudomonadota bacterium]